MYCNYELFVRLGKVVYLFQVLYIMPFVANTIKKIRDNDNLQKLRNEVHGKQFQIFSSYILIQHFRYYISGATYILGNVLFSGRLSEE